MIIRRAVKFMFGPRVLFATNVVSSGVLLGLGDWIVQLSFTNRKEGHQKTDWVRTGRMFTVGIIFGPALHGWYKFLDRILPFANLTTVAKKVFLDQMVAGPLFLVYFFIAMGLLQGQTLQESLKELRHKFLSIFLVECTFWPTVQGINFYFLPSHLRVVYFCAAAGIYDSFLSFMKFEPESESLLIVKPKD